MVQTVVLDTNVLVSAIVFGGKPRQILELAIEGKIQLACSEQMLGELDAVLRGRKFKYPPEIIHTIKAELESLSKLVRPSIKINQVKADPADNKFLECAIAAKAECIVTGDAHLLRVQQYKGIAILSPADFLIKYTYK